MYNSFQSDRLPTLTNISSNKHILRIEPPKLQKKNNNEVINVLEDYNFNFENEQQ